jgi:hypothetical protein
MKAPLIVGLVFAVASAQGQSVVLRDPAHSIGLVYERTADKATIVETLTWSTGRSSRIVKSTYGESGELMARSVSITNGADSRNSKRIDSVITTQGATVTITSWTGAGKPASIPLRQKMNLTDPSVRWFVTDKPEKGASFAFMSFDPEFRYWEEETVTFEGRGKLGNSPEGNLVTRKSARKTVQLVLDDKGLPLVWVENKIRVSRESH